MKNAFNITVVTCLLFGMTLGCSGGRKPIKTDYVEGKVTYKGVSVDKASVSFSPVKADTGHSAYGRTDNSGTYKIQTFLGAPGRGTTPGEYIVTISKTEGVPTGRFSMDEDGNRIEVDEVRNLLPVVYNSAATTPLRATVTSGGPNKFDFDLVDEP